MTEPTPGAVSLAETAAPTLAVTPATPDAPPSDSLAESESISLEEAKKLRREAQGLRTRLKTLEDAEAKVAQANLSETERERNARETAERERDEARTETLTLRVDSAIEKATRATSLNARDASAIDALINRAALTTENGTVTGIDAEIARIKKAHPALFFNTTADGASGGTQTAESGVFDFNAEIRRRARRG